MSIPLQVLHTPAGFGAAACARGAGEGAGGPEKKEKCGVFGVWGAPNPARLAYFGLYAQQHRGQESAGIAVTDGESLAAHTGMGLVAEVFTERTMRELVAWAGPESLARASGSAAGGGNGRPDGADGSGRSGIRGAIGHNRYSTTGASLSCNAQPILESYIGGQVAVGHNGNLLNAAALRQTYEENGHIFHTTSDSEVVVHLLASPEQQRSTDPLASALRRLQGAFSMVFLFPDRVEAARDPWGWRPLVLGRAPGGYPVVASETVALDAIAATYEREVEPGEIVTLSDDGVSSRRFAESAERPAHCVFEHVYFAHPSSRVFGKTVQIVREKLGEQLAREAPVEADCVIPMPDSGRSAAHGYALASGVPYREGIVPNRYVGRTFIKPTQNERTDAVRLKLNVVEEIVRGKRIIIVDDSIVRGTTTKAKMDQLRSAGAKEIHLRISCPPIRHPCYFGVDFAQREELIAHERTVEDIRAFLGVDSLHYLSLEGMLACSATPERPAEHYCTACYSGEYRLDPEQPMSKGILERRQMKMFE
ncbi:MAG: amidophosphoribosyltransferase [Phycisphaeraceae bacterium]|nr:MAG: amidophosphoribosyltransferase [Phycisphaeraceae bacterium]